ncbi:MAG: hypothetical protein KKA07_14145 [Bacteroidetes bacterium]|nr:hypothetical protein [Bacteroidota bacterium]MBU1720203.1 hypothetical protein [Bacteroidota bacterium]
MTKQETISIREKIMAGFQSAIDKLIARKIIENGDLVFYENGKIVHKNARDIAERRK